MEKFKQNSHCKQSHSSDIKCSNTGTNEGRSTNRFHITLELSDDDFSTLYQLSSSMKITLSELAYCAVYEYIDYMKTLNQSSLHTCMHRP